MKSQLIQFYVCTFYGGNNHSVNLAELSWLDGLNVIHQMKGVFFWFINGQLSQPPSECLTQARYLTVIVVQ